MAYNDQKPVSREAGTDVTAYRFVAEAAGGIINLATVAGQRCDGVATITQDAGDEAGLWQEGDVPVEAGAAVADGAEVMTDADGKAITYADHAPGGSNWKLGKVVNGTSASGDGKILTVHLYQPPVEIAK